MSQANTNQAATISKANGPVTIERDGQELTLEVGDSVYSSDIIKTNNSSVELSFTDGSSSTLAPQTILSLNDYEFSDANDSSFVMELTAGAMRTISGGIVDINPDAFKVITPRATVGIRGTTFITQLNDDGSETHVVVSLGAGHNVVVTTYDGQLVSLITSNQGTLIPVEGSGDVTPYTFTFTQQEVDDLVNNIVSILGGEQAEEDIVEGEEDLENEENQENEEDTNEENNEEAEETQNSIEIDQSVLNSLSEETIADIVTGLENLGIEVEIVTNETSIPQEEETILVPGTAPTSSKEEADADGYFARTTDGKSDFYPDFEFVSTSGAYEAQKHRIDITGDIDENVIISGDVHTINSGSEVTGADDLINGLGMSKGTILGDAHTVKTGATLIGGNDTITLTSKTGGNSIYGDAHTLDISSTASFGDDIITINGDFSNSIIVGDIYSFQGTTVTTISKWGADTITIQGNMTDAKIYGDASMLIDGGNDTIIVRGTISGTSYGTTSIEAGHGDDTINLNIVGEDARISAESGNDTITINSMTGGFIAGGDGADTITVEGNVTNASIYDSSSNSDTSTNTITIKGIASGNTSIEGGVGTDNITVKEWNSAYSLLAEEGDDSINVTTLRSGGISAGDGNDTITINNYHGGTIEGGSGTDTLTIHQMQASSFAVHSTIEEFRLGTATDLTLTGSANTYNSKLKAVDGSDFNLSSGSITNATTSNALTIHTVSGTGIFKADADGAQLAVTNMLGGEILGNAGNDTITVSSHTAGSFTGAGGTDTLTINSATANSSMALSGIESLKFGTFSNAVNISHDSDLQFSDLSGDVYTLSSGKITFTGEIGTTVTINSLSGTGTVALGDNTVYGSTAVGTNLTVGTLSGDASIIDGKGNNDITVGTMSGGSITTSGYYNNIIIDNYYSGSIAGSDDGSTNKLKITNLHSETLHLVEINSLTLVSPFTNLTLTGDGISLNDLDGTSYSMSSGTLTNATDAQITLDVSGESAHLKSDDDGASFYVYSFAHGTFTGSAGVDSLQINAMNSGTINTGAGDDIIRSASMNYATINTGTGDDRIETFGIDGDATITNEAGTDTLELRKYTSSTSTFNDAEATLTLSGDGDFTLTNGENAGYTHIQGTIINASSNSITIDTIAGGTFKADADGAQLAVTTLSSGAVNGGAGDDSIYVENFSEGTINLGAGTDILTVGALATDETAGNATIIDMSEGANEIIFNSLSSSSKNYITFKGFDTTNDTIEIKRGTDVDITSEVRTKFESLTEPDTSIQVDTTIDGATYQLVINFA